MDDYQRNRLNQLVEELQRGELNGKPMSPEEQVEAIFELGLKLGQKRQKKQLKKAKGHPASCTCEICFAAVHEVAKTM
jgi:hypothetical protein